jgi:hypothetical protein
MLRSLLPVIIAFLTIFDDTRFEKQSKGSSLSSPPSWTSSLNHVIFRLGIVSQMKWEAECSAILSLLKHESNNSTGTESTATNQPKYLSRVLYYFRIHVPLISVSNKQLWATTQMIRFTSSKVLTVEMIESMVGLLFDSTSSSSGINTSASGAGNHHIQTPNKQTLFREMILPSFARIFHMSPCASSKVFRIPTCISMTVCAGCMPCYRSPSNYFKEDSFFYSTTQSTTSSEGGTSGGTSHNHFTNATSNASTTTTTTNPNPNTTNTTTTGYHYHALNTPSFNNSGTSTSISSTTSSHTRKSKASQKPTSITLPSLHDFTLRVFDTEDKTTLSGSAAGSHGSGSSSKSTSLTQKPGGRAANLDKLEEDKSLPIISVQEMMLDFHDTITDEETITRSMERFNHFSGAKNYVPFYFQRFRFHLYKPFDVDVFTNPLCSHRHNSMVSWQRLQSMNVEKNMIVSSQFMMRLNTFCIIYSKHIHVIKRN